MREVLKRAAGTALGLLVSWAVVAELQGHAWRKFMRSYLGGER